MGEARNRQVSSGLLRGRRETKSAWRLGWRSHPVYRGGGVLAADVEPFELAAMTARSRTVDAAAAAPRVRIEKE